MSSADSQFAATQSAALRAGALRKWLAGWMGGGAREVKVGEDLFEGAAGCTRVTNT